MQPSALWQQLLTDMRKRFGHQDVEIWLANAEPLSLDQDTFVLQVPNKYYSDWITENYLVALREMAREALERGIRFEFVAEDDPVTAEVPINSIPTQGGSTTPREPRAIGLKTTQTFENFVIGECNKFAHAAARAVADYPASNYNPLFVYGSTGLGKTHLMHAIGNHILSRDPNARVVYVTAEDFMNDMINCIRYKRMEDFRNKYRKRATLLLVDDIQFLSGRDRTQEEFFHTFNALQNASRQIVLTADVLPKDIDKLEPRLRTRFEGGLLADLQAPDRETLQAILRQKADHQNIRVPNDLADLIASTVAGNIRELEGILNRLVALHNFHNEPLTVEFAREHMGATFRPQMKTVTVASIIEEVARMHNLRLADITGHKRTRTLTVPRQIAMYLARKHTQLSFPELGREFGGRDHSTIQYGCRKVDKARKDDADLDYKIRLIEQSLGLRSDL